MGKLARARDRLEQLPATSRLRTALPEGYFAKLEQYIEQVKDLRYWPPFFGFLLKASGSKLVALESDLDLVLRNHPRESEKDLTDLVRADKGDGRTWHAGLFDLWVRATLLRQHRAPEFDVLLPNGRNTDVRLQVGQRRIRLENTVLTEDDESKEVFDRFLDAKTAQTIASDAPLSRPGPFDPPDAKGPSPFYNTVRLYAKVYDKLAARLDPDKSQCADDEPNVLLVSFAGFGVAPDDPGYGWALDGLLGTFWGSATDDDGYDISLRGWLLRHLDDLVAKNMITLDEYHKRIDNLGDTAAVRGRLSGIVLFDDFRLAQARINYNAREPCLLTHGEMAKLERLLDKTPVYS
jgi:hypothetical protein